MVSTTRPLSAYNLFYRYKRDKILEANKNGVITPIEIINRLIAAVPGLEECPSIVSTMSPARVKELRRAEIRAVVLYKLSPQDTDKCSHRKSLGVSFLELSKIMIPSCE